MTLAPKGAFDPITAAEWNELISQLGAVSVANADATSRTTTSTSFTSTLSPANICGVAFTAPPSGKVLLVYTADQVATAGGFSASAPVVKTGNTVGSGTSVLAATFDNAIMAYNGAQLGAGRQHMQTGLTPGTVYNAYFEHAVSAGTGTFRFREFTVLQLQA